MVGVHLGRSMQWSAGPPKVRLWRCWMSKTRRSTEKSKHEMGPNPETKRQATINRKVRVSNLDYDL